MSECVSASIKDSACFVLLRPQSGWLKNVPSADPEQLDHRLEGKDGGEDVVHGLIRCHKHVALAEVTALSKNQRRQ
jgi:hypothetical protein